MDIDTHNQLETKLGISLVAIVTHVESIVDRDSPVWEGRKRPVKISH